MLFTMLVLTWNTDVVSVLYHAAGMKFDAISDHYDCIELMSYDSMLVWLWSSLHDVQFE